MMIERLKVNGLLSFGPHGIDLRLEPLNVFIGPNGSGKSNLLKVLGLLQAAPTNLSRDAGETGDVHDWFCFHNRYNKLATIDATVTAFGTAQHLLTIAPAQDHFQVLEEKISLVKESWSLPLVQTDISGKVFVDCSDTPVAGLTLPSGHSLLSLVPELPTVPVPNKSLRNYSLQRINSAYQDIQLRRNWIYGDSAPSRQTQSADSSGFALAEHGDNLPGVLSRFSASQREELTKYLSRFYDGIVGISTPMSGDKVSLLLEESGGRQIPAARLSDGTLRYLNLLAALLNPEPPPLIAIEEPELGLHPDVIYDLSQLLVAASHRTQVVVTTHSPTLVDALTDHPTSIVTCEKYDGQTQFRRIAPEALLPWLNGAGLGAAWSQGAIGGNRW